MLHYNQNTKQQHREKSAETKDVFHHRFVDDAKRERRTTQETFQLNMMIYSKNKRNIVFNKDKVDVENDPKYKLIDDYVGYRGKYYLRDLDYNGSYSESLDYAIELPNGNKIYSGGKKGKPNTWRWSKEKYEWGISLS